MEGVRYWKLCCQCIATFKGLATSTEMLGGQHPERRIYLPVATSKKAASPSIDGSGLISIASCCGDATVTRLDTATGHVLLTTRENRD